MKDEVKLFMTENHNNHFRTSDTSLAAFLRTEGYLIIGLDDTAQRVTFIIEADDNDPALQNLMRLFLSGKAQVEPSNFLRNYKALSKQARDGGA